jgi:pyruvate/2-oxoglutarate dehydrogenase complex dihydrolipoamide acyltransferase (E2) component
MKIQANSDKTIQVDATLTRFVEDEASRLLDRFAKKLTRVEVHLSDIDNTRTGQADKRCLVEARPAGDRPLTASATTTTTESSVTEALKKMQRLLTTFFGRKGRPAAEAAAPASQQPASQPKTKAAAKKTAVSKTAKKKTAAKKAAVKKSTKLSPRGPKKKGVYQARRKSWPKSK